MSIRHLAQSPAIVQASEVEAISLCVWLPHYPLSASEITEVLEFASTNNQSDLVSLHHLLVNYLLPSGSDFINCDRTWRGLYQYTLGLPDVPFESYPFILVTVT